MSLCKKLSLGLIPVLLAALFPLVLSAQDSMTKQDQMGNQMADKMSATGCLMKGTSPDGYYLKGDDGKTYELWGYKGLSEHVNHKVTVTGMEEKMSGTMEKEREANEKAEAGGGPQMDLRVMHVKMVSESCQ
jgi:hypothetical protein